MRRRLRFGSWCVLLLVAVLPGAGLRPSLAQPVSSASSLPKGKVVLERMVLLLEAGSKQQGDLDALLKAQSTAGNAGFHRWVTPDQFGARYANSPADVATVVGWLKTQGFAVAALPAGRGWIEFTGSSEAVAKAFGVGVKTVPGSETARYALNGEIKVPAAIAGLVKGLVSLDGVESYSATTMAAPIPDDLAALVQEKSASKAAALTPALMRSLVRLSQVSADGSGETIAIPSRSNVRAEDFAAFRKSFGLPDSTLGVVLNGSDPGRTGDEAAAIMAASWAGVAAPGARVVLVPAGSTNATDGVDLALAAVIDGALAHTVSVGYVACEAGMSEAHRAFYAALYRQAAAEGIAIVAATGDSGAGACHRPEDTQLANGGYGVNALASTVWDTAVGTTSLGADEGSLEAWETSDKTAAQYASGGGASRFYSTPEWQSAGGLPAADPGSVAGHHRYLPDLSLPAADDGARGLAFCLAGDSGAAGCRLVRGGGSAGSAALFAGVAAVLAQKYGAQGNLAPHLYSLNRECEDGVYGCEFRTCEDRLRSWVAGLFRGWGDWIFGR